MAVGTFTKQPATKTTESMKKKLTCILITAAIATVATASTGKHRLEGHDPVRKSGLIKSGCKRESANTSWICIVEYTRNRICGYGEGQCTAGSEVVTTENQCTKKAPRANFKLKASGGAAGASGGVECEIANGQTCDEGIYQCNHSSLP
jgi:hypothetical protein